MKSPFATLGFSKELVEELTNQELFNFVELHYKQLSKKYHPDRNKKKGSDKRFREIQDARDFLDLNKDPGTFEYYKKMFLRRTASKKKVEDADRKFHLVAFENKVLKEGFFSYISSLANPSGTLFDKERRVVMQDKEEQARILEKGYEGIPEYEERRTLKEKNEEKNNLERSIEEEEVKRSDVKSQLETLGHEISEIRKTIKTKNKIYKKDLESRAYKQSLYSFEVDGQRLLKAEDRFDTGYTLLGVIEDECYKRIVKSSNLQKGTLQALPVKTSNKKDTLKDLFPISTKMLEEISITNLGTHPRAGNYLVLSKEENGEVTFYAKGPIVEIVNG